MRLRNSRRKSQEKAAVSPPAKRRAAAATVKKSPKKKKGTTAKVPSKVKSEAAELFYISTEPSKEDEHSEEEEPACDNQQKVAPELEQKKKKIEKKDVFYISTEPSKEEEEDASEKKGTEEMAEVAETENEDEKPMSASPTVLSRNNVKEKTGKYSEQKEKVLEKFIFGNDLKYGARKIQQAEASSDSSDEEEDEEEDESVATLEKGVPEDKLGKRLWGEKFTEKTKKRKAAWHDQQDEDTRVKDVTATYTKAVGKHGNKETSDEKYSKSLKRKYISIVGTPKWADLDKQQGEDDQDSDDEFFRETTDMLFQGRQTSLTQGRLEYRKLKDLNHESHSEGTVIRSTEFHPHAAVGLVAGLNGTASLFKVDGKLNPKIQTVNFENFPIKSAHFSADGKEFIVGSQHHAHFFVYDMHAGRSQKVDMGRKLEQGSMQRFEVSPTGDSIAFLGRFGEMHFMNARTKDRTFSLKMNDDVTAIAFTADGQQLYSHGAGGEIYLWDVRFDRSCVHRFVDDGCIRGTTIAVSRDHRYLAAGSDSGVVNVYDCHSALASTRPKPEKILLNLTTSVGQLKFNPDSSILAMSSELKENAVKLVHVPSRTVFSNFPSWNFNLKRVNCFDFSLNGGYFSVGNNGGAANLYRLKHFGSY